MSELPPLYQLHPVAVHFTVALIVAGALFKLLSFRSETFCEISFWLLRLAALSVLVTAPLGWYAMTHAPHVPAAWDTMYDHKWLGISTSIVTILLWIIEEKTRHRIRHPLLTTVVVVLWLAVVGLVLATGSEGGELVYHYGVAIDAAPHI